MKHIWVRKAKLIALISSTSKIEDRAVNWYFDSGCSRHMTSQKEMLTNLKPSKGQVTFGDGVKGKILATGTLHLPRKIKLDDVLLVQGLRANLISISQLCDEGWKVNFNKNLCLVKDQDNNSVMEGKRSSDKCYILTNDISCFRVNQDLTNLWHQ